MGIFGSFNPFKAVTRAIGIHDTTAQFIADVFPVSAGLGATPSYLRGVLGPAQRPPSTSMQPRQIRVPQTPTQYGQPQYGYYGGGGYPSSQFTDPYSYGGLQPYTPLGGPASWDYSTPSQIYSVPQYQDSSGEGTSRTWEDLALGILPLFL